MQFWNIKPESGADLAYRFPDQPFGGLLKFVNRLLTQLCTNKGYKPDLNIALEYEADYRRLRQVYITWPQGLCKQGSRKKKHPL
jgi:hypothetical protein